MKYIIIFAFFCIYKLNATSFMVSPTLGNDVILSDVLIYGELKTFSEREGFWIIKVDKVYWGEGILPEIKVAANNRYSLRNASSGDKFLILLDKPSEYTRGMFAPGMGYRSIFPVNMNEMVLIHNETGFLKRKCNEDVSHEFYNLVLDINDFTDALLKLKVDLNKELESPQSEAIYKALVESITIDRETKK